MESMTRLPECGLVPMLLCSLTPWRRHVALALLYLQVTSVAAPLKHPATSCAEKPVVPLEELLSRECEVTGDP